MGKKAVDIRDVAALAGVSVGSASRVINRVDNVSIATREKVERAIQILGYRPNHTAQSLRSRASKTIGCLFTDVANPLYANLFRSLEERLRVEGYMLLLANGLNDVQRELETLETFARRGMDGVIAAPDHEKDEKIAAALSALAMPVVVLDRDISGLSLDTVLFDHAGGVRESMARLFDLGHRRISIVLWNAKNRPVRRRLEGYRAAYKVAGVPLPDGLIVQGQSAISSVLSDFDRLLKQSDRPTAVLAQGTYALGSVMQAIALNNLSVPRDISVVAIGDTPFARENNPAISMVTVDSARVAALTAEMLRDRMENAALPARVEKVPVTFTDRASVGSAPN